MEISILKTRIVDDHAEYGISCNGSTRISYRRYREFEALRNNLLSSLSSPPALPPKTSWWSSKSDNVVSQRREQLEKFLKEVISQLDPSSQGWSLIASFVGAPQVESQEVSKGKNIFNNKL